MESPTGIIPEELMYRAKKKDVIAWIQAQPWPSDYKRRILEGWQTTVGIRLHGKDFRDVERTGVDYP